MTARELRRGRAEVAANIVLLAAPLVLLAVFFRDLWWSAHAFSLESADNLDLVYPLFGRRGPRRRRPRPRARSVAP